MHIFFEIVTQFNITPLNDSIRKQAVKISIRKQAVEN